MLWLTLLPLGILISDTFEEVSCLSERARVHAKFFLRGSIRFIILIVVTHLSV